MSDASLPHCKNCKEPIYLCCCEDIVEKQAKRIAELEAALAPFADPKGHWADKLFSKAVVEAARKAMGTDKQG